jgi:ribose/xylose/arabinose/galactoside ABC-type transport system permease subunit
MQTKEKKKLSAVTFLLIITIGLFVVMYAIGAIAFADKGFAKPQMFMNLFISNAGLIVIGCGLTIVMITGGIDISVGSVTALVCMVSAADLMENKGMSAYMALFASLSIGLAFGVVQGYLVSYLEIQPFIITLAGLFFGRGMTAVVSTDMIAIKNETVPEMGQRKNSTLLIGYTKQEAAYSFRSYIYPTVVVAMLVVHSDYHHAEIRTKFGRALYAIGGNQQSAVMMGLNVRAKM